MNPQRQTFLAMAAGGLLALGAPALLATVAPPAFAQAGGMSGIGSKQTVTTRATVKAVDLASRTVTLQGPEGETINLKVGNEVRNLPQVKVGDTVIARYHASVAFVLSAPGTSLPPDTLGAAGARAQPGQLPAGAVVSRVVVTGLVVGVDPVAHTLALVDPAGGAVRHVHVTDPRAIQSLNRIKVGDTITAVVSEAVAVAVEPAS